MFFPFKTKTVLHFCLTVFLFVFVSVFTSCKKNCECLGTFISIVDSLNNPLPNVNVRLHCENSCPVDVSAVTNSSGIADFIICDSYILKVEANGTPVGYIDINEDDVTQQTYSIN